MPEDELTGRSISLANLNWSICVYSDTGDTLEDIQKIVDKYITVIKNE